MEAMGNDCFTISHSTFYKGAGDEYGADKGHFVEAAQSCKYINLLMKAYLELFLKSLNEDVFISWWNGAMVIVDMICWDKPRQVLPNNTDPRHNKNVCMKYVITTFNLTTRIFEVYRSSKYA